MNLPARVRWVGPCVAGVAIGCLAYRVILDRLLAHHRVVASADYANATWRTDALRFGPWILLGVALLLLGLDRRRYHRLPAPRAMLGAVLFGAGASWFALSSLDMHGLALYDWRGGGSHLVQDALYHGAGAIVAAIGWLLLTDAIATERGADASADA